MKVSGTWAADAPFLGAYLICESLQIRDYLITDEALGP